MSFSIPSALALLAFFIPLLSFPPLFAPPDWAKALVLHAAVSILWIFFLWSVAKGKRDLRGVSFKGAQGVLLLLLFLQLVLFALASLLGPDPMMSVWGDPVRSGGLVNLMFLASFALLLFLSLDERGWRRVLSFALAGAAGVSIIAIFQWLGWFSFILLATGGRPASTLGSTMTLGLFLLLFTFLALSREGGRKKGLALAALFIFVIALTETRAALLGLGSGLFFFLFWHPNPQRIRALFMKYVLIGLMLAAAGILFAANFSSSPPDVLRRLKFPSFQNEPRFSAWQVATQAITASPFLGYGPENFAVGFDKFYDPALPNIGRSPGGSGLTTWWDRAHNIFLDTASSGGMGAAFLLLVFWVFLFWNLQRLKKKGDGQAQAAHGLQAAFLGYVVAMFFSFETFSSLFAFFLLFAYALHLLRDPAVSKVGQNQVLLKIVIGMLGVFLVWFNWHYTLKPLAVNAGIVEAKALVKEGKCPEALQLAENTAQNSPASLRAYSALSLGDVMLDCQNQMPSKRLELAQKAIGVLQAAAEARPLYPRTWIALGGFTNVLAEGAQIEGEVEKAKELAAQAEMFFRKALEISPKRQEIYTEWIKTFLIQGNYAGAGEKARECLSLNINSGHCWFLLARAEISIGNAESGAHALATAEQLGYNPTSRRSLLQLSNAYLVVQQYEKMAEIYERLSSANYDLLNRSYHETLIALYQQLGQREKMLHAIGKMYLVFGDYANARTAAKECIALNSQSPYCWYLLSKAESALGNEEEAKEAKARSDELFRAIGQ